MKKILVTIAALLTFGAALSAQNKKDDSQPLPGSWVREKGEIVQIGLLESESRCLSYEEIQDGLPADDFIAIRKAFRTYDIGQSLIAEGIGYAAGYALGDFLYCKLSGYDVHSSYLIVAGVGAVVALTGAIMVPISNKKIDKILTSRNGSVGLNDEKKSAEPTITILPTVVTSSAVKLAPGVGVSVRF